MRALSLSLAISLASCTLVHERGVDAGPIDAAANPDASDPGAGAAAHVLWVLVHPTNAPLGPGVFQFDEGSQQIVSHVPLPDGVMSPHGLAWDGTSLWLGDIEGPAQGTIYQLDPQSGAVLSHFADVGTEGIAVDGDTLWYSSSFDGSSVQQFMHVTRAGDMLSSLTVNAITIQDLVLANGAFYYLVNDDADRIVRVDHDTGAASPVTQGVDIAPYSLGFDGQSLAVAVDGHIRRYDPATGALVSDTALAVPGWITAIAFVR